MRPIARDAAGLGPAPRPVAPMAATTL